MKGIFLRTCGLVVVLAVFFSLFLPTIASAESVEYKQDLSCAEVVMDKQYLLCSDLKHAYKSTNFFNVIHDLLFIEGDRFYVFDDLIEKEKLTNVDTKSKEMTIVIDAVVGLVIAEEDVDESIAEFYEEAIDTNNTSEDVDADYVEGCENVSDANIEVEGYCFVGDCDATDIRGSQEKKIDKPIDLKDGECTGVGGDKIVKDSRLVNLNKELGLKCYKRFDCCKFVDCFQFSVGLTYESGEMSPKMLAAKLNRKLYEKWMEQKDYVLKACEDSCFKQQLCGRASFYLLLPIRVQVSLSHKSCDDKNILQSRVLDNGNCSECKCTSLYEGVLFKNGRMISIFDKEKTFVDFDLKKFGEYTSIIELYSDELFVSNPETGSLGIEIWICGVVISMCGIVILVKVIK